MAETVYLNKSYRTRGYTSTGAISHVSLNLPGTGSEKSYLISGVSVHCGLTHKQLFFDGQSSIVVSYNYEHTDFTAFEIPGNSLFYFTFYVRGDFPLNDFEELYEETEHFDDITIIILNGPTDIYGNPVLLNPGNPENGPISVVTGDMSGETVITVPGTTGVVVDVSHDFSSGTLGYWEQYGTVGFNASGAIVSSVASPYSENILTNSATLTEGDLVFGAMESCTIDFEVELISATSTGCYLAVSFGAQFELNPGAVINWYTDYFENNLVGTVHTGVTEATIRLVVTETGGVYTVDPYYNVGEGFVAIPLDEELCNTGAPDYTEMACNVAGSLIITVMAVVLSGSAQYLIKNVSVTPDTAMQFIGTSPSVDYTVTHVAQGACVFPFLESSGSATRWLGMNQGHMILPSFAVGGYQTDNDRADVSLPVFECSGNIRWVYCSMEFPALEVGGGSEINWGEMTFPMLSCDSTLTYAYFFAGIMPTLSALSFGQGVPSTISNSLKPGILLEEHPDITEIANTLFLGM